jgi:hypothetical protein
VKVLGSGGLEAIEIEIMNRNPKKQKRGHQARKQISTVCRSGKKPG